MGNSTYASVRALWRWSRYSEVQLIVEPGISGKNTYTGNISERNNVGVAPGIIFKRKTNKVSSFSAERLDEASTMNITVNYDEFLKTCVVLQRSYKIIKKIQLKTFWINHILVVCLQGVMLFPTIILNSISAITIFKSSQLKNKTCYFLILVQSTLDLAVGLVGIRLYTFLLISELVGVRNCYIASSLGIQLPFIPCHCP